MSPPGERPGLMRATILAMSPIISVSQLSKTYASGFQALKSVDLEIRRGEIFALLGPNGAGKTTLINIICGIVKKSSGSVRVDGHDIVTDYRAARSLIGLVPQELSVTMFDTAWTTASFSRGLFGKPADPDLIAKVLKDLSLYDRKDSMIMTLSGKNLFPSVVYTVLQAGQTTFGPLHVAAFGTGPYFHKSTRWGDYSWAILDPNGNSFWMATEYIPPRSSQTTDGKQNWGTRVIEVSA